ncbi:MAG: protein kinase [Hamadaea sp.]|uniref:serine/threonine-protein kinase n=1 Tax=Hamadaea sp. TaxID=2024425 RepID=UPI0017FCD9A9|nr:protein kinase [Hamadaea sp.]NUR74178.1 protein kinase [Hamadaea sp.]NUT20498.1 protein kinase [Hamadaea sp.]
MPSPASPSPFGRDALLAGRYRTIEALDSGGMATVWRARDEHLDRDVAIKVLAARLAADPAARVRLRMEAQALASLDHPHIATVYDYGVADVSAGPLPFLVLELVSGVALSTLLSGGRTVPWRKAAAIIAQTAAALASAHEHGVVHRDVSAANILLSATGVKLIDFGICVTPGHHDLDEELLLGTPAYIAPERLEGHPGAYASDVFSLGVILYRMLTGRAPFPTTADQELFTIHRTWSPRPLPAALNVPDAVAGLCQMALAKDPAARPSAADIARTLAPYADSAIAAPIQIQPPEQTVRLRPEAQSRRSRVPQYAVAAVVLVATGVAGAWALGNRHTRTPTESLAAAPSAAAIAECAVTYQNRVDDGRTFSVDVTVANLTNTDLAALALTFELPGDQRVTAGETWVQRDHTVTTARPITVPAGGHTRLSLGGSYAASNAYPVRFHVGERTCSVTILGPAGIPISTPTATGSPTTAVRLPASPPPAGSTPSPVAVVTGTPTAGVPATNSPPAESTARPRPTPSKTSPSRPGPAQR